MTSVLDTGADDNPVSLEIVVKYCSGKSPNPATHCKGYLFTF